MAYKINGTTVVDNSRNVCACCVTSCCITASDRMDAPSGTTANRPASPATGSVYFDTDLGALISYDGSNWVQPSGGVGLGLSSGLVNSDTEAWSAVHINVDDYMCRGVTGTSLYCKCYIHKCTGDLIGGLYNTSSNRASVSYGLVGSCAYNAAFNCVQRPGIIKECGRYGVNFCNPCAPFYFMCGIQQQYFVGSPGCGGLHGRFFNDGSFEYFVATYCQLCYNCGCANNQRSIIFDKYGNNHLYNAHYTTPSPTPPGPIYVPENSYGYINYLANGLNAPLANLRQRASFYTGTCHTYPLTSTMCAAWETCSDYLHQNGYEICDTLLFWQGVYGSAFCKYPTINSYSKATAFYPLETGFCIISCAGHCLYICGPNVMYGPTSCFSFSAISCCCGDTFTYLSKCPQYDYRDPNFYTPKFTTPSGAKIGVSDEAFTNSIGYLRLTHFSYNCVTGKDRGFYGGAACTGGRWNSFYWFSQDKCKLYHIYFRHCGCGSGWAKFSCSACQSVAGDKSFNDDYWPATEVIDTTNGCVICSIYYCQYKDCQIPGSTYPYAVPLTCCCAGFYCTAPFHGAFGSSWGGKANGVFSWLEGHTGNIDGATSCMIRSCACPARVYMVPQPSNQCGNIKLSVFNECTLNFECTFPAMIFNTCLVCDNLARLIGGSVGCCYTNTCLQCTFACDFTSTSTPPCRSGGSIWSALNCTFIMNNATACQIKIRGFNWYCGNESSAGNFYYVNPTNDHLVMLLSIGHCATSSCSQCTWWFGAVCWDIENCCISKVESLFPTHGDKCIAALACGPKCWGTCSISDMSSYSQISMATCYCICSTNLHCNQHAYARTFATRNHTCGGVTVILPANIGRDSTCILSTCCQCSGNSCFDICLCRGYFGKCGLGGCVINNSCCQTGQKQGLAMQPSFAIARVPWEQPLSCSGLFEEDAGMKCLFEMTLGCHNLGCSLYCNVQCCIDRIYICNFTPEFNCIVDITCQYTCNCCSVFTWGGTCWCSRYRWVIFDVATTCVNYCQVHNCCCKTSLGSFASFMCCDVGGVSACWDSLLASCTQCKSQFCTGWNCALNIPCNDYRKIPTVLMCVTTDTVFKGDPNHRNLSNPSGSHYIQGYDQIGQTYPGNSDNSLMPSSGGHFGWLSYNQQPCCKLSGKAGPMKYWFDKYYAEVL